MNIKKMMFSVFMFTAVFASSVLLAGVSSRDMELDRIAAAGLAGTATGSVALVLGAQSGAMLGAKYGAVLGSLAGPAGAVVGGVTCGVVGGAAGFAAGWFGLVVIKALHNDMKRR